MLGGARVVELAESAAVVAVFHENGATFFKKRHKDIGACTRAPGRCAAILCAFCVLVAADGVQVGGRNLKLVDAALLRRILTERFAELYNRAEVSFPLLLTDALGREFGAAIVVVHDVPTTFVIAELESLFVDLTEPGGATLFEEEVRVARGAGYVTGLSCGAAELVVSLPFAANFFGTGASSCT